MTTPNFSPLYFLSSRRPKSQLLGEVYDELADVFGISRSIQSDSESFEIDDAIDVLINNFVIERSEALKHLNGLIRLGSLKEKSPFRGPLSLPKQRRGRTRFIMRRTNIGGTFQPPTELEDTIDLEGLERGIERFGVN